MAAIFDFRFLCISCKILARLCSWVYVEMISTGQPFTTRHVPQTLLAPWVFQSFSRIPNFIKTKHANYDTVR